MAGPEIFDAWRLSVATGGFDWTSADIRSILVDSQGWTPAPGDTFVLDALTAGAVEAASTSDRQALTGQTAAIISHKANLSSDPISYPNVANMTPFDTLILFVFVTDDSDSPMIACFDYGAQTGDGNTITLTNSAGYIDL